MSDPLAAFLCSLATLYAVIGWAVYVTTNRLASQQGVALARWENAFGAVAWPMLGMFLLIDAIAAFMVVEEYRKLGTEQAPPPAKGEGQGGNH